MTDRKKLEQERNRQAWQRWLEQLDNKRNSATAMGGEEKLQRLMHSRGKLDARQRLQALFDPGTFVELGQLVGNKSDTPADAFVCGSGRINGRMVLAGAEDFTLYAGSCGEGGHYKRHRLAELALQEGLPLVWMLEGAGARIGIRTSTPARTPVDLTAMADAKGEVPVVCLVMGVSAGHGALAAPLSDFIVMTASASMFTGGPPLVEAATGAKVDKHALGGPRVCSEIAGTAHNIVDTDSDAIALARHYLSFFPGNRHEPPPQWQSDDSGYRDVDELLDIIPPEPHLPYHVRDVIEVLADDRNILEIQPHYGKSLVTALCFIGGQAVAVVANNPAHMAGALDADAAIKGTDFIETAGTFNLPVIFLLDNPGVMAGVRSEEAGILKWGAKMFLAGRRLKTPKISVLMRKGFGFGLVTMAHMPHDNQTLNIALPSANIATMPAQSGGKTAKLDEQTREKIARAQTGGPYGLADRLGVDDVVAPAELRNALINGLALCARRRR